MKWRTGELDQRIILQRETLADDGMGGSTVALNTVATVWAKAIPLAGREGMRAARLDAAHSYTFVIRYRADLRESDRILWEGAAYNIRAIARHGGRELYLEIDAERGVAQ